MMRAAVVIKGADMSRRYRRRPETPEEIEAENVDFWTRTAERYERTAQDARAPGVRVWAAHEAERARAIETKRRKERA